MNDIYKLCDLKVGECAKIVCVSPESHIKRRLCDIGLIEETPVRCVAQSPCRDMKAYLIRGAVVAIRDLDSKEIKIRKEVGEHGTY